MRDAHEDDGARDPFRVLSAASIEYSQNELNFEGQRLALVSSFVMNCDRGYL
jgi:hypothetical protein